MRPATPKHWKQIGWEEKAQENPLWAVMTTRDMTDAPADGFTPEQLEAFFAKGRSLYRDHLAPLLARMDGAASDIRVLEYGCGAGRILNALVEAGHPVAGVDISATMLGHCSRLVPSAELFLLDETGRSDAPDAWASLVFSYSVLQHIASLERYVTAVDEICRVLAPGGMAALQVNCEDFSHDGLENPGRTENFEDHSLHYRPGESEPYDRHVQDHWGGVRAGHDLMARLLAERGLTIERWYYHNPKKLRAVWVVARKAA